MGVMFFLKIKAVLIILEQVMCYDQFQVSLSKFSTARIVHSTLCTALS